MIEREKLELVKRILRELHSGVSLDELKERYRDILKELDPSEIPAIEQALIEEGISFEEIVRLCDLHLELFKLSLERAEIPVKPKGHPLGNLMEEVEKLNDLIAEIEQLLEKKDFESLAGKLEKLYGIKRHFMREWLLVFPYLERRGITSIPRVLWARQEQVLSIIKRARNALIDYLDGKKEEENVVNLLEAVIRLCRDMALREQRILFPLLDRLLSEGEWRTISLEEKDIGFFEISPPRWESDAEPIYPYQLVLEKPPEGFPKAEPDRHRLIRNGDVEIDKHYFLSPREIGGILRALPVEITFTDADGRVRYFNRGDIFARPKTVIGRRIEFCHPPAGVELVRKVVDDLKSGKRSVHEFRVEIGGRKILIQYLPVRSGSGEFVGVLEVVQDVTELLEKWREKL